MLKVIVRYLFIGLLVVAASSCNPEEDTIVIIKVVDIDNNPQAEAYVSLSANPSFPLGDPSRLFMEKLTDATGQAVFDYTSFYKQGQSGFAVLDITSFKDSLVGYDLVKVLEEEVNEKKVFIE